jgi:hypothetical protein
MLSQDFLVPVRTDIHSCERHLGPSYRSEMELRRVAALLFQLPPAGAQQSFPKHCLSCSCVVQSVVDFLRFFQVETSVVDLRCGDFCRSKLENFAIGTSPKLNFLHHGII